MGEGRPVRVVHVVYSFGIGGLENVIVQLINRLPPERFEHVVLALTTVSDFQQRVAQAGVRFIALNKPPGHAVPLYPRVYRLLRELQPDVLHTCNLAALELVPLPGWRAYRCACMPSMAGMHMIATGTIRVTGACAGCIGPLSATTLWCRRIWTTTLVVP